MINGFFRRWSIRGLINSGLCSGDAFLECLTDCEGSGEMEIKRLAHNEMKFHTFDKTESTI